MKTKEMKTVTLEQFMKFDPCWLYEDGGEERLRTIAKRKKNWSALDVLALEEVPANDRLWAVLREEFIDEPILHEFACRCAEDALKLVDKPDPRSVAAIETKRRWLRGEATDEELAVARCAAWSVARCAAQCAAWSAARSAARCAAESAAQSAARCAAWSAARCAAESAAQSAARCAQSAARCAWSVARCAQSAARCAQSAANEGHIKLLIDLITVRTGVER